MHAIEFEAELQQGMIKLPASLRHWHDGQLVKVVVLTMDSSLTLQNDINRYLSKVHLTQEPLEFQTALRNEWQ